MLRSWLYAMLLIAMGVVSHAAADIIVTAETELTQNDTHAFLTYHLYAGSSTATSVGVAKYAVNVDISSLTPYLASPVTLSSVAFANPNGANTASIWATPGSGFASFAGSPGGVVGSVITFSGDVGNPFLGNVSVTQLAVNAQHRLGSITLEFLRPTGADLNLSLAPASAVFQTYDLKSGNSLKTLSSSSSGANFTITHIDVVPEPSSIMALLGVLGTTVVIRRRR